MNFGYSGSHKPHTDLPSTITITVLRCHRPMLRLPPGYATFLIHEVIPRAMAYKYVSTLHKLCSQAIFIVLQINM